MSLFSQAFPPSPTFTEKELPDQTGKVVIVTGAASGVGLELAKILYSHNATVYVAARSFSRVETGIKAIRAAHPSSKGRLESFVIDLADLETVKPAVAKFLEKEDKLHVLVHNAAVMVPPAGSRTKHGHDLEMGTNCLGPFLLSVLLEPIIRRTAVTEGMTKSSHKVVRIVWVSSMINSFVPKGGITFDEAGNPTVLKGMNNYMVSKCGDVFLAAEFAKRLGNDGILSVSLHPGLMRTELQRHISAIERRIMSAVFKPPKFGAYTELYAGFSPDVTPADNGGFFIPWGRKGVIPPHLQKSLKTKAEMGTGISKQFLDWCEAETRQYV